MLSGSGLSGASEESNAVVEYLESRSALADADRDGLLTRAYAAGSVFVLDRFGGLLPANRERFFDYYLGKVEVEPDPRFAREGDDIALELPVSLTEAVLGGRVPVPTPTGTVTMTVPKGANTGTRLRLRGKGAPRREGGFGDEYVTLKIVLPASPDPDLEAFVAGWEAGRTFNPREDHRS